MNGAKSLVGSLAEAGVDVCFANPGTSEMFLVQAIDAVPAMRPVLALFEGVCTGAADGFGRMTGKPATTLLHLGPGMEAPPPRPGGAGGEMPRPRRRPAP